MGDKVRISVDGGIATLTLHDPPANTYSYEMMQDLDAAIQDVERQNHLTREQLVAVASPAARRDDRDRQLGRAVVDADGAAVGAMVVDPHVGPADADDPAGQAELVEVDRVGETLGPGAPSRGRCQRTGP